MAIIRNIHREWLFETLATTSLKPHDGRIHEQSVTVMPSSQTASIVVASIEAIQNPGQFRRSMQSNVHSRVFCNGSQR